MSHISSSPAEPVVSREGECGWCHVIIIDTDHVVTLSPHTSHNQDTALWSHSTEMKECLIGYLTLLKCGNLGPVIWYQISYYTGQWWYCYWSWEHKSLDCFGEYFHCLWWMMSIRLGWTLLYGEHISHGPMLSWSHHGHMLSWSHHGPMPVCIKGQLWPCCVWSHSHQAASHLHCPYQDT